MLLSSFAALITGIFLRLSAGGHSIKPSRYDILENEEVENIESVVNAVNVPTTDSKHEHIDVSALTTVNIDMALLNDALRHKMSM